MNYISNEAIPNTSYNETTSGSGKTKIQWKKREGRKNK